MTTRRVALNEILRLSKRVFLALGAGAGCEYDPALAVVWLESRGLPGLEMLWRDRQAPGHGVPARVMETLEETNPTLRIHGDGASGVWVAAATADWLVASGEQATVTVEAIRSPLWFIPALAARGGDRPGWMVARVTGEKVILTATWDAEGAVLHFGCDLEELPGREAAVTLGCGSLPAGDRPSGSRLTPRRLQGRHAASLAAGVQVDESRWLALYELARGALVPETEASRIRGAGAQGQ